jgi:hypothetical protein
MKKSLVRMSVRSLVPVVFVLAVVVTIAAQAPPPDQGAANVAGKWTIYSKSDDGRTDTKYVELKQDGGTLTGHFKGPNQSGGLEGTVEGKHIVFRTKTRNVLTFRGQVDDEGMHGRWGIFVPHKGLIHGDWQARREE